jgi:Xaa-Pro aminopeptidase
MESMDLDIRALAEHRNQLLNRRLDTLVPPLMDRAGLDAWVVMAREYNEDPVLATMLPEEWMETARRRTVLVFLRNGERVHRLAVARYAVGDAFPSGWEPEKDPDQLGRLAVILDEADPPTIGVNTSEVFALADGLTATERDRLLTALPLRLRDRVVSAEKAAIGWLETRLPEEIEAMAQAASTAHEFLRRALSPEVIEPGVTTTKDVEWWLRTRVREAGHGDWFHPTCSVQRAGGEHREDFSTAPPDKVITGGDLVHIDFGIVDGGLCTDQQQHAYVLRLGETAAPDGLIAAMAAANRLQDLLMAEFVTGRTGNQILAATREKAASENIDGLIYTHPLGLHGHAAGPTIGLWDQQDGVPGQGDYSLWPDTAHSIELQARHPVDEWGRQVVELMLEEDAWFDGVECRLLDGRQTSLWLV